ncbi:serine/threonine-protein kinase PknK [Polyangium aurulentum]|uniref:serine/threonine-protein kinase n=1 Tax=Polyangium aurulentum TaxID=2567896 RepID=UPI0010ADFA04|nr:serine/threonine-protein kinase [Polyangium aurulentum]UQA62607.1 protein kinase [Polyangium aurulentum]
MQPGHTVDGRFVVERFVGQGGMARVFRANDLSTGEAVALKVLLDEAQSRERFEREADILASLRHPGIVRYVARGTSGGFPYIAMEWVEGESLARRIQRQPLTVRGCVRLIGRLADALGAAHERGVVHRDLTPANVMLVEGDLDRPKVLDFGIARLSGAGKELTRAGMLLGSMGYMAPEQARGARDLDARADVFALGCLLLHALTGKRLFEGSDSLAYLVKVVVEDAPRLRTLRPDAPASLEALLARMLARAPADRPPHAAALLGEIRSIPDLDLDESTADAPPSPALGADERRLRCVLLVRLERSTADAKAAIEPAAQPFEAGVDELIDGHLLVTFSGGGAATDEAARAARCALEIGAALEGERMAIAATRSAGSGLTGGGIEALLPMLERAPADAIAVDDVTAGLLGARFDVTGDAEGLYLRGERDMGEAARTLLGKPTPCVGRDAEIDELRRLFVASVQEATPRAVIVTGAAGIGKSRLRHELMRWVEAQKQPVEVWIGHGDPMGARSPFGMLSRALRRAAGIGSGEPVEVQRRKLKARVGRHLDPIRAASVVEFLGELSGTPFDEEGRPQLAAARRNAMLMGDRIRRAFEDFVSAELRAGPLLLVLEDMHFGDKPSVNLVEAALGGKGPLFVLALARPEVRSLFPDLWSQREPASIDLGPLDPVHGRELVRAALGPKAKSALVAQIVERAEGNAFYLEELVRAAAQGKDDALPESVIAMVQGMLEELDPQARRLLRAASVYGDKFGKEGVVSLLGDDARGVGDILRDLCEREVIERRELSRSRLGAHAEEYAFRHAYVREAAYAMLTEEDRVLGHMLAARHLTAAGEPDPTRLAEHFERAGEPSMAVRHYLRAAEQALGGNDLGEALSRAERGIACGATGEELGRLLVIGAEAHRWRGENLEAMRSAAEAIAVLARGSHAWCVAASELVACTAKLGDPGPLERVAAELSDLSGGPMTSAQLAACARVATPLYIFGKRDLADDLLSRAATPEVAGSLRDPSVRARIYEAYAIGAFMGGDPAGAVQLWEQACASFTEIGDVRSIGALRSNQGVALNAMGAYAEAEAALRAALEASEPLGIATNVCAALQNLGFTLVHMGRLDEAQSLLLRSIREALLQRNYRLEAGARIYMAVAGLYAGKLDLAEPEARAAAEALGEMPLQAYALGVLSMIELLRGRLESAEQASEQGMKVLAACGGAIEEGEAMLRLAYAETLVARGDAEGAGRALFIARRRIEERAMRISKPEWRQSFLDVVPENRRTFERAASLGV